ncbi:MAG: hypothetical protein KGJ86_15280 [Chloroflexota bacterium]|nr:hypothetical protein [Chloroflexota bacterium]
MNALTTNMADCAVSHERYDGARLIAALAGRDIRSIRMNFRRLLELHDIRAVIMVGASASGKTTLVNAVRSALAADRDLGRQFTVPIRIITRPVRQNDDQGENIFVTANQFDMMVSQGSIALRWIRLMEAGRTEAYGFRRCEDDRIHVYSANNGLIYNEASVKPEGCLSGALIVLVYCPDQTRKVRLEVRSPDIIVGRPAEASFRLQDRCIGLYPQAHLLMKNFGRYQSTSTCDVVELLRAIYEMKRG